MKLIKLSATLLLTLSLLIATGCAATATKSSTGEYIDDTVITTRVKTAIFTDPVLKVAQINVETYKSIEQLSGFVDTREDVVRAGSLARSVAGVTTVHNNIIIK